MYSFPVWCSSVQQSSSSSCRCSSVLLFHFVVVEHNIVFWGITIEVEAAAAAAGTRPLQHGNGLLNLSLYKFTRWLDSQRRRRRTASQSSVTMATTSESLCWYTPPHGRPPSPSPLFTRTVSFYYSSEMCPDYLQDLEHQSSIVVLSV